MSFLGVAGLVLALVVIVVAIALFQSLPGPSRLDVRAFTLYALRMLKSSISSKGQVTVPAEVRERLGLAAGTAVTFELRPDGVLLKKGGLGAHPVDTRSTPRC
jgi:AbrB family looped-hinge helix DNA binding protein